MAKLYEQASQRHEIYCRDLEVMSSKPSWVELGIPSTSVQVILDPKISFNAKAQAWVSAHTGSSMPPLWL